MMAAARVVHAVSRGETPNQEFEQIWKRARVRLPGGAIVN
jgi:hypothetical protein